MTIINPFYAVRRSRPEIRSRDTLRRFTPTLRATSTGPA